MNAPLHGIRVVDLSRVLAGPWAGQLLGDFGADVVKVERPHTGDDTRQWGPPWLGSESAYFLSANRNKRSLTADLSTDAGKRIVRELVGEADVVIENFRVGTLARFGLSAEELMVANPGLIVCSISAFGQSGSRAGEPGYDAMVQASAGLMSVTGPAPEDGGGPQKVGVAIADIMAGMYAVYHGPDGIRAIAQRIHNLAGILAEGLRRLGHEVVHDLFFDTVRVRADGMTGQDMMKRALDKEINLREFADGTIGIALDEGVLPSDVDDLFQVFGGDMSIYLSSR